MPLGRRKDKSGTMAVASASPHIVAVSLQAMLVALSLGCTASKGTGLTLKMAARCVSKHVKYCQALAGQAQPRGRGYRQDSVVHQATVPRWNMGADDVQETLLVPVHCLMQVARKQQLEWICVIEAFENCLQARCKRSERS